MVEEPKAFGVDVLKRTGGGCAVYEVHGGRIVYMWFPPAR
jgi:hypothetical protein